MIFQENKAMAKVNNDCQKEFGGRYEVRGGAGGCRRGEAQGNLGQ